MISISYLSGKGIDIRRTGRDGEYGSGVLVAKAAGDIRENPYPSYPRSCTVSITNPVVRIT